MVYQGPDVPAKPEKRIVVGETGILNRHALQKLDECERIYKTEGISDMLALQDFIPEEMRDKHIVITNACGADDGAPAWGLAAHCAGKEFVVIHDADIPGQFGTAKDHTGGAQRWVKAMKTSAKSVKNVQLPYEVASKHGKDLRDWIQTPGRKYADLLELVEATKEEAETKTDEGSESTVQKSEAEAILERLNLVVLGHDPENSARINMFSQHYKRRFSIKDLSSYKYVQAIVDIGPLALSEIDPSADPTPAKVSLSKLRNSVAEVASARRISHTTAIGPGFWEIGNKLVMVGAGEWTHLDEGKLLSSNFPALKFGSDSRVVDFADAECRWYDRNEIETHLHSAKDPAWRSGVFDHLAGVFCLWDNWELSHAPDLLAGLALCSWIQDVWSWRPWIALSGKSNCGKSTLMKFLSDSYFGKFIASRYDSSTEAGIRQSVGTSSRVMLLDELEKTKERGQILQWLKACGGGGQTVRGTPGQQSVSSQVKVMPWMASTEYDLSSETVRNRYLMLHMKNRTGKPFFRLPSQIDCETLRHQSLAIVLTIWREAKQLHRTLTENVLIPDVDTRYIETYSLPIAMQAAVKGMREADAEQLLRKILESAVPEIRQRNMPEHEIVLNDILTATIQLSAGSTKTVSELIPKGPDDGENHELLQRHGLKVYSNRSGDKYLFVSQSQAVKTLLKNTPQQGRDVTQILARVEGALCKDHRQRLSGTQQRGVSVPWSIISPLVDGEEEEEKDDFVPKSERSPSVAEDLFGDDAG